jgi:hypothetical protein
MKKLGILISNGAKRMYTSFHGSNCSPTASIHESLCVTYKGDRLPETNSFYCRIDGIISRDVNSGTVMLKMPTASYYGLDEAGTMLWNALTRPCGTQDLVALLRSEFQIAEDSALCDVNSFVHDLLAEGLIELTAGAATSDATPRVFEPVISITARNARMYAPPVLERGLLRNAAHHAMGSQPDGGQTPGGTSQFS